MTLYDRILVPTDGSAEGKRAVVHALDLASVHGATVHALYVIDTASYVGPSMERSWEGIGDRLRDDANEAVAEVEALATETDLPVETAVVEGPPSAAIIDSAERADCDLIVMGTHGRGGINRLLLGSVAETVVRGSTVPVLTVQLNGDDAESERPMEAATVDGESERDMPATPDPSGNGDGGATSES